MRYSSVRNETATVMLRRNALVFVSVPMNDGVSLNPALHGRDYEKIVCLIKDAVSVWVEM